MQQFKLAVEDLKDAIMQPRVWLALGVLEVRQRYQRSVLGPWWASLSMLMFMLAIGCVFSRVFSVAFSDYLPFFASGYVLWCFISSCIQESTELFRINGGLIKQIKLPYHLYVLKFLTRNATLFLHNLVVYLGILYWLRIGIGWNFWLAIPSFAVLVLNLYWICLLVGLISTRFRDMTPIVGSCLQILFLATPISWNQELIGKESMLIRLNPLACLIDIVRRPLLGREMDWESWLIATVAGCVGMACGLFAFSRVRSRIAFWLD